MEPNYIDVNGEQITPDSLRATMAREHQADIDARFAAAFSTSSEHAGYPLDAVREMYKGAR